MSSPTEVKVNLQELIALYDPANFVIGVRRGALSPEELIKLQEGELFQFNGTSNDFVILPKTLIKEQ